MSGQVFQFGTIARQGHRQAGALAGGFTLQFAQQAARNTAHAGYFTNTEMADLPAVSITLHNGGTEQTCIEAGTDHAPMGQVVLQQTCGIGVWCQQPVRCIGVDFVQVGLVLTAGQLNMFQIYRHAELL